MGRGRRLIGLWRVGPRTELLEGRLFLPNIVFHLVHGSERIVSSGFVVEHAGHEHEAICGQIRNAIKPGIVQVSLADLRVIASVPHGDAWFAVTVKSAEYMKVQNRTIGLRDAIGGLFGEGSDLAGLPIPLG